MSPIDIYKYPGEDVLKNKFDCHDNNELQRLEAFSTAGNIFFLQQNPIEGNFDFEHLKAIHYFIFKNVYDWAGKIRTVDIGKNNIFCRVHFIDSYAKQVFSDFFPSCFKAKSNKPDFLKTFTSHYADLNALHPFREGNGRTQREFARELCLKCGYVFDLTQTNHKEMLDASIESFNTFSNEKLLNIFSRCVIPVEEYENYQTKLTTSLLIFSKDDIPSDIRIRR